MTNSNPRTIDDGMLVVAIDLSHIEDGGPEEGGWSYEAGTPVAHIPHGVDPGSVCRIFRADEAHLASAHADAVQRQLDERANKGRPTISSALAPLIYTVRITDQLPAPYPAERPRYE